MLTVLTIAGFDPSSGAGITADLAVFAAHGLFGTACITALTVQNTVGVAGTFPVEAGVVRATLENLQADLPPVGIKIGMLATGDVVETVADFLEGISPRPVLVLDPVLRSTSGKELLDVRGVERMRVRLLPLVDWITPNVGELGILSGNGCGTRAAVAVAAQGLQREYPRLRLVVTGGDEEPPDDLLVLAEGLQWLGGERVKTNSTHGTGCAFSSALLSRLALGDEDVNAARGAKDYVTEALRRATPIGHGRGPIDHLWPLVAPR